MLSELFRNSYRILITRTADFKSHTYNENVEVVLDEIWNSSEFPKDFFWKKQMPAESFTNTLIILIARTNDFKLIFYFRTLILNDSNLY